MINRLLLVFGMCATVFTTQAQPKIIPPSPNAAAFAKYGDIPVSTYTGVPNISIPLYEIKVRDISVPITLSYHASGIKVGEEASKVGLGWVLNAGGLISRNIMNDDDLWENNVAWLSSNNLSPSLPEGPAGGPYLWLQGNSQLKFIVAGGQMQELGFYDNVYDTHYDFQPDEFNYNFLGHGGKFVLDRNGIPVYEDQEKIRIRMVRNENAPGQNKVFWEATTSDGYRYLFNAYEYYAANNNMPGNTEPVTAWYLTDIFSPQNEHVTFTYLTHTANTRSMSSRYEVKEMGTLSCNLGPSCNPLYPVTYQIPQAPQREYTNVYLSRIDWSYGYAQFDYQFDRSDVQGDNRLTSIKIFKTGGTAPLQEFALSQDYFTSPLYGNTFPLGVNEDGSSFARKRLKLVSLMQRSGVDPYLQPLKWSFSYYEDGQLNLPAKNSYGRDHWGYYNGKISNTSLLPTIQNVSSVANITDMLGIIGPERNPSPYFVSALSLKEITYPTKGRTTFYYSANDYDIDVNDTHSQREAYTTTTSVMYDMTKKGQVQDVLFDLTNEFVNRQGKTIPLQLSFAFRTNGNANNIVGYSDVYFELQTEAGGVLSHVDLGSQMCSSPSDEHCLYWPNPNSQENQQVITYKNTYVLPPGKYHWIAHVPATETRIADMGGMYTWWVDPFKQPQISLQELYGTAGGIRIRRIEDFDPESGGKVNVREYNYHFITDVDNDSIPEEHSYGKRMVSPSYSYFDVDWQRLVTNSGSDEDSTNAGTGVTYDCDKCYHLIFEAESNTSLTNSQGNSVGYSQVRESFGENGALGYVDYIYHNEVDQVKEYRYPYDPGIIMKPSPRPTLMDALNGKLYKKIVYDAAGKILKRDVYRYDIKYERQLYGLEVRQIPDHISEHGITSPNAYLMATYPALHSTFITVNELTETTFKTDTDTLRVITDFSYDNAAHLQLTKQTVTESNGHKTITTHKYPADYSDSDGGSTITAMKNDKFMHSAVVETTVTDQAADGTQKVLHRNVTTYGTIGSLVLPTEQIVLDIQNATATASVPGYVPSATRDPQVYRRLFTIGYDANGNVQNLQKESDFNSVYLWGYNQKFPIAEIKNATASNVFHTSFEEDGTDFLAADNSNLALTGTKAKASSSYTFPASFTPAAGTLMSYWYWQNNKWNYSGVVAFSSTITTSGDHIDEVRAFPKGSMMSTYTFDPMIGITTATDANSVVSYYNYDAFGRLVSVKDQYGRVLTQYQYHYKD